MKLPPLSNVIAIRVKESGVTLEMGTNDIEEEDQGFELDRISSTRSANVARAFAWWISRDCISITILKVRNLLTDLTQIAMTYLYKY